MKGTKVLGKGTLNAKGKIKVVLKKALPAGKTKVKVAYLGDDFTSPAKSKKVVIPVRRDPRHRLTSARSAPGTCRADVRPDVAMTTLRQPPPECLDVLESQA